MFNQIGPLEIVVVLVIVLLIFGPKRLPQLGRQMGRGMREFKDSITGERDHDEPDDRALDPAPEERSAADGPGAPAPAAKVAGADDAPAAESAAADAEPRR